MFLLYEKLFSFYRVLKKSFAFCDLDDFNSPYYTVGSNSFLIAESFSSAAEASFATTE